MHPIHNGMRATDLGTDGWHKPWSGTNGGACLEAKKLDGGRVALRQSTDAAGPARGAAFYYLVSGRNACGEGPLGAGSNGQERPNPSPCP